MDSTGCSFPSNNVPCFLLCKHAAMMKRLFSFMYTESTGMREGQALLKPLFFVLTWIKHIHYSSSRLEFFWLHFTHSQIKTPDSYQNIFYSGLLFHWSDWNDNRSMWCELQKKNQKEKEQRLETPRERRRCRARTRRSEDGMNTPIQSSQLLAQVLQIQESQLVEISN